jgi:hypothetical protein
MSGRARLGLIALAVAVVVAAFIVINPGGDDDDSDDSATTAAQTQTGGDSTAPTATAESAPTPPPDEIVLRGGKPVDGIQRIEAKKGDTVRIVVSSDESDELHLHGYDIERAAAPGKPARFRFKANAEGVFELESHTAEDAGLEPLIARVVVQPS